MAHGTAVGHFFQEKPQPEKIKKKEAAPWQF